MLPHARLITALVLACNALSGCDVGVEPPDLSALPDALAAAACAESIRAAPSPVLGELSGHELVYDEPCPAFADCSLERPLGIGAPQSIRIAIDEPLFLVSTDPSRVRVLESGNLTDDCLGPRVFAWIEAVAPGRASLELRFADGTVVDRFAVEAAGVAGLRIDVYDLGSPLFTGAPTEAPIGQRNVILHLRGLDAGGGTVHLPESLPVRWNAVAPDGTESSGDSRLLGFDGYEATGTHRLRAEAAGLVVERDLIVAE
jgi:hypothetical protein